ncbi:MAG: pyridoxal phosphate-dependent aminotransferase [Candidatus Kerfeldbacteria bacterium]|nr:pyridoxal phosphate-dependent aminotransferase [Candidatus Kerfeldbacteria bacterium]
MIKVTTSPTIRLDSQVKALQAAGHTIINLTVGELDFETPKPVLTAVAQALQANHNKYTTPQGLPSLRQAITQYLFKQHGLSYTPDQVIVTNGAKQALYSAFQVLLHPGDEVLVPMPAWVSYGEQIHLAGGQVVPIQLDAIAQSITERTTVLVLNYPNNPTGAVYSPSQLAILAKLAEQHHLWVVSDEIYERIIYPGTTFQSFGQLYPSRTIIVNGVSKSGAMTGWRVGYAAGPDEIITAMTALQSHLCGNVNNIAQIAAQAALQLDDSIWQTFMQQLLERRTTIMNWMKQQPQLQCIPPQGAFYCWLNIQGVTADSEEFCERLLHRWQVALVPGKYFGQDGYVRLSFAHSLTDITLALQRISQCVDSYDIL